MVWVVRIILWAPIVLSGLILAWLFFLELKDRLSSKTAGRFLAVVIGIYFLDILVKIIYTYFKLKGSSLGQYFLPGSGDNYFYRLIWDYFQPSAWAALSGLGIILILIILRRILKSTIVDKKDLFIIILTVFVVGTSNVLVLIVGSFLLMLFVQLGASIRQKKMVTGWRLKISPFLLPMAILLLILNNFTFYLKFLALLRLI